MDEREPRRGSTCKGCGKPAGEDGCYCPACLSTIARASLPWRKRLFGDTR